MIMIYKVIKMRDTHRSWIASVLARKQPYIKSFQPKQPWQAKVQQEGIIIRFWKLLLVLAAKISYF